MLKHKLLLMKTACQKDWINCHYAQTLSPTQEFFMAKFVEWACMVGPSRKWSISDIYYWWPYLLTLSRKMNTRFTGKQIQATNFKMQHGKPYGIWLAVPKECLQNYLLVALYFRTYLCDLPFNLQLVLEVCVENQWVLYTIFMDLTQT